MRAAAALLCVVVAACGDDGSEDPSPRRDRNARDRIEAELKEELTQRRLQTQQAELMVRQAESARLTAQLDLIYEEVADVERELAAATTDAAKRDALRKLEDLRVALADVRTRLGELKSGTRRKCPPDDPFC